jgi:adenylate kinase family enzyme
MGIDMSVPTNITRIAILGYSGSGKSTLATQLAAQKSLPVLHLDTVHWLPEWVERSDEECTIIVNDFLDHHSSWVIEGNYPNIAFVRRLQEADVILILDVNRITCLCRAVSRWWKYRGSHRPNMTAGCNDKLDAEFLWWLVWKGRSPQRAQQYRSIASQYREKCVITH